MQAETKAVRHRPSHLSLESRTVPVDDSILSPRTPKSIQKPTLSRRTSNITDALTEMHLQRTPSTSNTPTTEPSQYFPEQQQAPPKVTRYRSPSIGSTASFSSRAALNANFDVHTMYKIKTSKSNKKLDSFFGEAAPMDICIQEIRKEGLKAMLQSKVPLCFLLYHLLDEYSSENLFFFVEVEQYESFTYISKAQQSATATHILDTYLSRNSHLEVNVEDKVIRSVTTAIEEGELSNCFQTAKRSVFTLLDGSFHRFKDGPIWDTMVATCGELTTHYSTEARNTAVTLLLQYLERQHNLLYTNPHVSVPKTSRRRHELLMSMIHEFSRQLLDVQFAYYHRSLSPEADPMKIRAGSPMSDADNSGSDGDRIKRPRSKSVVVNGKKNKERGFDLFGKKVGKSTRV
ncbi:G-protein signaling regulator protein [Umbelopsis sp. WA50703]